MTELKKENFEEAPRESGFCRIVGAPSHDVEKYVLSKYGELFDNQKMDPESDIAKMEREKTQEEIVIINAILKGLPDFLKKYGAECLPVTPAHIHFNSFQSIEIDKYGEGSARRVGMEAQIRKNQEEIFNCFARVAMTGNMQEVARLVKQTLGKSAFRNLGKETKGSRKKKTNNSS